MRPAARCVVCVVLTGCGGGGISLDELAGEMASATCEQMRRCCSPDDPAVPAECVATLTLFLESSADIDDMREHVAAGTLDFDEQQAELCIQHIRALSCVEFSAYLHEDQVGTGLACLDMLRGKLPIGTPIELDHYQCETGNAVFDMAALTSRCAPPIVEGGPCDPDCEDRFECDRCEPGRLCDQTSMTCQRSPVIVAGPRCDGV